MQIDDESKPLKKRKMDDKSKPLKKRKWSRTRNQNNWAFNFKRPLLAWEEDELQRFRDALDIESLNHVLLICLFA
ncbi:hypothetical protein CsSME_00010199 [Camellia sinensis var. sinensis]